MIPSFLNDILPITFTLLITAIAIYALYVILFHILRTIFRKLKKDIAIVTLYVSSYPVLTLLILFYLKFIVNKFVVNQTFAWLDRLLLATIIISLSYWIYQLLNQVIIYYLKEYAEATENMWDNVLLPLIEGVIPPIIVLIAGSAIIQFCLGIDLTGIWITLGGATFVIGFAVQDILSNFFSGIVLLIDSPFQYGDVLRFENQSEGPDALGILRKIGVRVTQVYMFESHTEVYIPNSQVQSQQINNVSRPIEPVYHSTVIELSPHCDLEVAKRTMKEIIQSHPDTLGNIDTKLECLDDYYNWTDDQYADSFEEKKEKGKARLTAENEVNSKLDEIEQTLEALILTISFLEEGGLDTEEIATIQAEFQGVLDLIGLEVREEPAKKPKFMLPFLKPLQIPNKLTLEESTEPDNLINLVREWYRIWLEDPNLIYQDQYVLSEIWERKIELLTKRVQKLYRTTLYPQKEETRLDDYVQVLVKWLRERFKQARSEWQEPEIRMEKIEHRDDHTYVQFTLNYYVDDIRLEDGERGMRINSDIHREIMTHLKDACI